MPFALPIDATHAALKALEAEGQRLGNRFDAALAAGDRGAALALLPEILAIVEQVVRLRLELGEAGAMLEFLQKAGAEHGIDISSLLGSRNAS
jgi:hypothetical protein